MFNVTDYGSMEEDSVVKAIEDGSKRKLGSVDKELIQSIIDGGIEPSYFLDKLVTFSSVMKGRKGTSTKDFIRAVQYCSYIAIGDSQISAYKKTFPDRVAKKGSEGTVSASASFYHRTDLVQSIIKMAQVPMHLIFMAEKYKAIQKLTNLMENADSERIQMESADKLLVHLKTPENSKIEIDIGFKKNETLDNLDATLTALARKHIEMIGNGHTAKDIVDAQLIESEVEDEPNS